MFLTLIFLEELNELKSWMEKNFGIFSRELRENQFFHAGNDFELKNDIIKAHNISQNSFNYKYSQIIQESKKMKRNVLFYLAILFKFWFS